MSVLILGASGFLGSWSVRALVGQGVRPVALVRPGSSLWRLDGISDCTIVRASAAEWPRAIAELRPQALLSLDWAGITGPERDDPAQWRNVDRFRAVVEAAVGSGVRRIVGVGSQAEFGPRTGLIGEMDEPAPVSEYGRAKTAARAILREMAATAGVSWTWARVFSTYGPLDHDHWLLPGIARGIMAGEPVPLTAGEQQWSYLHGADAGRALAMLAADDQNGDANVGSPWTRRLRDTVEEFARSFPTTAELRFGAVAYGPQQVMHLEPELERLCSLGWQPLIGQTDGLAMTAAWLRGETVPDPLLPGRSLPVRESAVAG